MLNVKKIRRGTRLSKYDFSELFGFPLSAVEGWEAGLGQPKSTDAVLLTLMEKIPYECVKAARAAREMKVIEL